MRSEAVKFLFIFLAFTAIAYPQLITYTPYFPAHTDSITVTFDATLGNQGLMGYTGDVYAHTGVITNLSSSGSDWKYVKTNWGVNSAETKLTRIGTDLYQFKIKPSVRSFYGVPAAETILQVAFVFRSSVAPFREAKTSEGGDIFLPLATGGLNVAITLPETRPIVITQGETIQIQAVSAGSNSLSIYVDNQLINTTASTTLTVNYQANNTGKKWIRAAVTNSSSQYKADSIYFVVRPAVTTQDLPAGIKDGINYTSATTATLVLYAPEKQFAYVMGDFTNWEIDPAYYMKRTTDGKRLWAEVSNLSPGTEYGYQYYVDGTIRVADPYADKLLDPWNDKWISSVTYPNLKPYPAGKTTHLVSVLQTGMSGFNWQVPNFTKPPKTDLVVYELLLRDFTNAHTYQSILDTLGYLKRLGVNAIQLMPVNEFEGNESWGYNSAFYFAPDKYYGNKNMFKNFIDVCHLNGIAVIMDIALNHSFGTSSMVRLYWDGVNSRPAANNPWFNQVAKHDYNVGYDFNHESQATKDFVDRVVQYWVTEYKIDGYRFDLSKGFTQNNTLGNTNAWGQYDQSRINLLKRMADKIWEVSPSAYVILEHFADNSEETVLANYGMMLWGNHNYNYSEAAMGYHDNGKSDFSYISYKYRGWGSPHLVGYMESHDEERVMYKNLQYGNVSGTYNIKDLRQALNRIKLTGAFFFTVPGPKMIWQFGEVGYDFSINYPTGTSASRTDKKPIRWDYALDERRAKVYKTWSALINLKKNYPAFESADFQIYSTSAMKKIYITHASMNVVVLGNFDVVGGNIQPNFQNTGWWYNYFSGDSMNVTNVFDNIYLQPGEFRIYTTAKLPAPEPGLLTDAGDFSDDISVTDYQLMQNYPNPFNPSTIIRYQLPVSNKVSLKVYDMLGKEIAALADGEKAAGYYEVEFDASDLSSGVYLYRLQAGNIVITKKLMLMK